MPHIHFTQIAVYAPTTHVLNSWAHPDDQQASGLFSPDYWTELAKILERGFFDGIFFADTLSVADESEEGALASIGLGAMSPRHDPFIIIPQMAAVTKYLGFASTLSTASMPPYVAVRKINSIDNISGGRFGWNVVMGHTAADFRALGIDPPPHDSRYDAGDEYMEICYRLWDAFPRDAVIMDKKRGIFIDVDKIKRVDFDGEYYSCHGYPIAMCSPQGRPLIFQAGQSGRGMRFGVTHGDAFYAIQSRVETMQRHMAAITSAAKEHGAAHPRVFFGIQPFVGSTEAEAQRVLRELRDNIPIHLAVNRLSALVGVDLMQYDLDSSLEPFSTNAGQGLLAALKASHRDGPATIREVAELYGISVGMPQFVGTPEQVADWVEKLWRQVGNHGFGISPNVQLQSMAAFADEVVPILQKRGLMRREYAGTTFRENLAQHEG